MLKLGLFITLAPQALFLQKTKKKKKKKSIPNLGLDPRIHWFEVTLVNRLESQRFVVEAGYPLLDYVDTYRGISN